MKGARNKKGEHVRSDQITTHQWISVDISGMFLDVLSHGERAFVRLTCAFGCSRAAEAFLATSCEDPWIWQQFIRSHQPKLCFDMF